jgi:chorismate--pyruvate lyase
MVVMYMNNVIPEKMQGWLSDPGSFMERLKRHNVNDARITVLNEGWCLPLSDERELLGIKDRAFAWVREVAILTGNMTLMFARTVIPRETLTGKERQLQDLKTRSLGSILFKHPVWERTEFDFFNIESNTMWHEKINKEIADTPDCLWARRSLFFLHKKTVLLTEVFFPEIMDL